MSRCWLLKTKAKKKQSIRHRFFFPRVSRAIPGGVVRLLREARSHLTLYLFPTVRLFFVLADSRSASLHRTSHPCFHLNKPRDVASGQNPLMHLVAETSDRKFRLFLTRPGLTYLPLLHHTPFLLRYPLRYSITLIVLLLLFFFLSPLRCTSPRRSDRRR